MADTSVQTSKLDANQVLRLSYDDENNRLRVAATVTATVADVEVQIDAADGDNIAISDPTGTDYLLPNPDGSINVSGPLTDTQLRATPVQVTLPSAQVLSLTPPSSISVNNFPSTQAISATTLPLPTTASTSTLQTSGNSSLSSIDSKLSGSLSVAVSNPVNTISVSNFPSSQAVTGPLTDSQLRATAVPVSGTITVSNPTTSVSVSNFPATQPVSAAALPLPSGASTSSLQSTANTSLASIDTKLTSPITVTGGLTDTQLRASAVPISGTVTVSQATGTNLHVVVDSPSLPSGAATSVLQTTGNSSLSSIDSKTPTLGQALAAASVPVVLTAAQITTLTPLTTVVVTGPLTDTQLRATAVPVSGTIAVSNPGLTDTQLRASQVSTSDIINTSIINGTLTVSTSAVAVRVGASNLASRKTLMMQTAGTIYWGTTSGVTTSTGFPFVSTQGVFAFGSNVTLYAIATANTTVYVMEGS